MRGYSLCASELEEIVAICSVLIISAQVNSKDRREDLAKALQTEKEADARVARGEESRLELTAGELGYDEEDDFWFDMPLESSTSSFVFLPAGEQASGEKADSAHASPGAIEIEACGNEAKKNSARDCCGKEVVGASTAKGKVANAGIGGPAMARADCQEVLANEGDNADGGMMIDDDEEEEDVGPQPFSMSA